MQLLSKGNFKNMRVKRWPLLCTLLTGNDIGETDVLLYMPRKRETTYMTTISD